MKDYIGGLVALLLPFVLIGAWLTHVVSCFIESAWGFLIAGAIMFPVAIIHGVYLWFT